MRRPEAPALLTLLSTRRSVRAFSSEPVGAELEEQLLAAARAAPSAGNAQCWYFARVRAASLRQELCRAALGQRFVATAPLLIVVCADQARAEQAYGERGLSL
jgi:nitroreductase